MSDFPADPSGVVVHNGFVHVVGNENDCRFFQFDAADLPTATGVVKLGELKLINTVPVKHKRAADLESIAVMEDGIVVLSEDSRRIIYRDRTLVDYSNLRSLKETKRDGCGIEGMAIRELPDHSSQIAVVWEGGIVKDDRLKPPLLLTHRVAQGFHGTKTVLHPSVWEQRLVPISLPESLKEQQFRCPDLTWCWSSDAGEWALLLLLSHRKQNLEKYLQLYTPAGHPIGSPQSLTFSGMPDEHLEHNWEGLCWHTDEHGDHLLLVNDTSNFDEMYICRANAPPGCNRAEPEYRPT